MLKIDYFKESWFFHLRSWVVFLWYKCWFHTPNNNSHTHDTCPETHTPHGGCSSQSADRPCDGVVWIRGPISLLGRQEGPPGLPCHQHTNTPTHTHTHTSTTLNLDRSQQKPSVGGSGEEEEGLEVEEEEADDEEERLFSDRVWCRGVLGRGPLSSWNWPQNWMSEWWTLSCKWSDMNTSEGCLH